VRTTQGFEDTVVKTGAVLYSSILQWNASRLMGAMATASADTVLAARMAAVTAKIKASADALLWNESAGMFMASTGIERDRIDVWANAFAGASGFASAVQSRAIFEFVSQNERGLFFEGQLRQLPAPQQWAVAIGHQDIDGKWAGNPTGPASVAGSTVVTYQNGGYWATPLHHMLPFLALYDRSMACRLLNESVASFRSHGINEWVGPFWPAASAGSPGYVASAGSVFFASEHLRCWE
jgi:hypothetical protein